MVLDDEAIVCERLKEHFEKIGISVEAFTESRKALHRLAQKQFDVLVTDLRESGIPEGAVRTYKDRGYHLAQCQTVGPRLKVGVVGSARVFLHYGNKSPEMEVEPALKRSSNCGGITT
jgi:DNA-binding NarL/FixJ family response regulator